MRLVLVPLALLFTPQQAAVFVNACWFTITNSRSKGNSSAASHTRRSRSTLPFRTSPTSKATWPPGRTTRASSVSVLRTISCHATSVRWCAMATLVVSIPADQLRSQLSQRIEQRQETVEKLRPTESKRCRSQILTRPVGVVNRARGCEAIGPSLSKEALFFRISFFTSRSGGVCPLFSLILNWAWTDTA